MHLGNTGCSNNGQSMSFKYYKLFLSSCWFLISVINNIIVVTANGTFSITQWATSQMELWGRQRDKVTWGAWRWVSTAVSVIAVNAALILSLHCIWVLWRYDLKWKKYTLLFSWVGLLVMAAFNSSEILNVSWRYLSNQMRSKAKPEKASAPKLSHVPSCVYVSSQDFSMDFGHCPEITVYTGCCLFPSAEQLATLWAENKKALLSMLVEVWFMILSADNMQTLNGLVLHCYI